MTAAAPGPGACVICAIVAGDAAAHVVVEDDVVVAFLDRAPLFPGHTLVAPRAHVETLRDLPDDLVGPFFAAVRRVAVGVQDGMDAHGTFVAQNNVVSQSVPHLHVHVVPRRRKDGLRGFFWPRQRYPDDEVAAECAARIRGALPERSPPPGAVRGPSGGRPVDAAAGDRGLAGRDYAGPP